ncbi:MAG: hypothetical protein JWP68_364, partial [Modestobacter sp.]|nr:hypothetical protein [Modestobacter sp.]
RPRGGDRVRHRLHGRPAALPGPSRGAPAATDRAGAVAVAGARPAHRHLGRRARRRAPRLAAGPAAGLPAHGRTGPVHPDRQADPRPCPGSARIRPGGRQRRRRRPRGGDRVRHRLHGRPAALPGPSRGAPAATDRAGAAAGGRPAGGLPAGRRLGWRDARHAAELGPSAAAAGVRTGPAAVARAGPGPAPAAADARPPAQSPGRRPARPHARASQHAHRAPAAAAAELGGRLSATQREPPALL